MFSETNVPLVPANIKAYIPLEAASAAIIAIGIAIAALGHSDTFAKNVDMPPSRDVKEIRDLASKAVEAA